MTGNENQIEIMRDRLIQQLIPVFLNEYDATEYVNEIPDDWFI